MTHSTLPFKYQAEKETTHLTSFSGLFLYHELLNSINFNKIASQLLNIKKSGWFDTDILLSLILLNIAGGDAVSDIDNFEHDPGFCKIMLAARTKGLSRQQRRAYEREHKKQKYRAVPSKATIHRYLNFFHSKEEEEKRIEGKVFIPAHNDNLKNLIKLSQLIALSLHEKKPAETATLDQDATIVETHKSSAFYCYKKHKAYQPLNTYWAEHGTIIHSEFRDGNVNAGFEQLRILKETLEILPSNVKKIYLRSDSAGYQEDLIRYCHEGKNKKFGKIEYAIAAKVSREIRNEATAIDEKNWHCLYNIDEEGNKIETGQEWTEICYFPSWSSNKKNLDSEYRYIVIREKMDLEKIYSEEKLKSLPFQTIEKNKTHYKLFAIITNRDLPGDELIRWHRERCGKSEQIHHTQKEDLGGGQLPSRYFGANAAWWQIMIIALNLNVIMQKLALPKKLKNKKMKGLRFHFICIAGRVIQHARKLRLCIQKSYANLFNFVRKRIMEFAIPPPCME